MLMLHSINFMLRLAYQKSQDFFAKTYYSSSSNITCNIRHLLRKKEKEAMGTHD